MTKNIISKFPPKRNGAQAYVDVFKRAFLIPSPNYNSIEQDIKALRTELARLDIELTTLEQAVKARIEATR